MYAELVLILFVFILCIMGLYLSTRKSKGRSKISLQLKHRSRPEIEYRPTGSGLAALPTGSGLAALPTAYWEISWDAPSGTTGDPTCCTYNLVITDTSTDKVIVNVTQPADPTQEQQTYDFTEFVWNRTYLITVTPSNSAGPGDIATLSFNTGDGPLTFSNITFCRDSKGEHPIQAGDSTANIYVSFYALDGNGNPVVDTTTLQYLATYGPNGGYTNTYIQTSLAEAPYTFTGATIIGTGSDFTNQIVLTFTAPSGISSTFSGSNTIALVLHWNYPSKSIYGGLLPMISCPATGCTVSKCPSYSCSGKSN